MKILKYRHIIFRIVPLITVLILLVVVVEPRHEEKGNDPYQLIEPLFVTVARAENSWIGQFFDDEAGISAYFHAPDMIDLNKVRPLFSTIELETDQYIIGSIPVSGYPDSFDVHVYVHVDGWILAYYPQSAPASFIFQLLNTDGLQLKTTILEDILGLVAQAANASFSTPTYYDFRYPNATQMMLIVEAAYSGASNSFQIMLPGSFIVYERSFGVNIYANGNYLLDGVSLIPGGIRYGIIPPSQLAPDIFHTFSCTTGTLGWSRGGVAIIYRVP